MKMEEIKKWELVNFCEFDKYAAKSYCAIHNVDESKNLGDITKVDENELEDFNMICGGSPCQDFSISGKQKGSVWTCKDCGHEYNPLIVHWSKRDCCPNCGSKDINKTRSSLLVEYLRVVKANKPNFGIYENVKNIVGKKFKETFNMFVSELEEYGYNLYYKVLNAKDYGIPQNRERVYLIFIRKDLDNGKFKFPEPFDNRLRLKDMLEDEVDEKFYISDEKTKKFIKNLNANDSDNIDISSPKFIGNVNREDFGTGYAGGVWDDSHISPTLTTMQGGGRQPHVISGIDKSYNNPKLIDVSNCITSREDRGISNRKSEGTAILENPDYSYCIDSNYYKGTTVEQYIKKHRRQLILDSKIRIRKLTPKECFRLMGFSDEAFEAAAYDKQIIEINGDELQRSVKLMDVIERLSQKNMEISVSCITSVLQELEKISTEWTKSQRMQEKEKVKNVNIVIEKLDKLEHSECAISIIKCLESTETLCGLIKEIDQHQMAIIELAKMDKQNTGRYMKITSEENLHPMKLYIILMVLELITESKIYTSSVQKVNIQSAIVNLEECKKNTVTKQNLSLKMDIISTRVSASQLYKQAGNSIVTDVLYYIYVELYKAMPYLFDDLKLSSFFSGIGAFEIALDRLYKSINSGNFTNPGM